MAYRAITQDDYDRMLAAFREVRSYDGASRLAGLHSKTAKRGWEEGWPKQAMAPIRDVIAGEQDAARKMELERLVAEAAEKGRAEGEAKAHAATADRERELSVKRSTQWARSAESARGNATALVVVQAALLRGAVSQVAAWEQQVKSDGGPTCPNCGRSPLDLAKRVRMLRDLTGSVRDAMHALQVAQEVEHLALGQPQRIEGHVHVEVSAEELQRRIEERREKLARAVARGAIPAEVAAQLSLGGNGNGSNGAGSVASNTSSNSDRAIKHGD